MRTRETIAAAVCLVCCTAVTSPAQEAAVNAEIVGHWDAAPGQYADVWGSPGVAYVAHFRDNRIDIIDVSDPANPTPLAVYEVPPNANGASTQDVKVFDGIMFVALESEGSNSIDMVDVRDPANPRHLNWVRIDGVRAVHNSFFDNGWLYLVDSGTPKVAIVDLRGYDPDNPPPLIDQAAFMLNDVGNGVVHDIVVQDGKLYACAWDSGLWVYDVSNLDTQAPTFLGSAPGENTHSCWVTGDNKFVVTGEERSGGGIKVWEIIDNGNSVDLVLRDEMTVSTERAASVHNQTIVGHRLYNAWYQIGLQVFDIDPVTGKLSFFASFDTSPAAGGGFAGAWGVYPFNGEKQVLVSDLSTGLWIIDVNLSNPPVISYPAGVPDTMPPNQGQTFEVQIDEDGEEIVPGSEKLFYREDDNDPWTETALEALGGGLYDAHLPPTSCLEDHFAFYISVQGDLGATVVSPQGAPGEHFDVFVDPIEPTITSHPDRRTVCQGEPAEFAVSATGTGTLHYQWSKDGVPTGSDGDTLTLSNVQLDDDGAQVTCEVTDDCGGTTSNSATLTVNPGEPTITSHPDRRTVCQGGSAEFTVSATGTGTLHYQWSKDGVPTGSDSDTLTLSNVQFDDDGAQVTCEVTDDCGGTTSNPATVTVRGEPSIVNHPQPRTVCESGTAEFTVSTTGPRILHYQWFKDGVQIDGANNASYMIDRVSSGDAGAYSIEVAAACGDPVISEPATLMVVESPAITVQPRSAQILEGQTHEFCLTARGSGLSYQWRRDGEKVAGATDRCYSAQEAGVYACIVANSCGIVVSAPASLAVEMSAETPDSGQDTPAVDEPSDSVEGPSDPNQEAEGVPIGPCGAPLLIVLLLGLIGTGIRLHSRDHGHA